MKYDIAKYASLVKPIHSSGHARRVFIKYECISIAASRVNFNASLIGDMQETQEVVDYCAKNNILPATQLIKASEINNDGKAWWRKKRAIVM